MSHDNEKFEGAASEEASDSISSTGSSSPLEQNGPAGSPGSSPPPPPEQPASSPSGHAAPPPPPQGAAGPPPPPQGSYSAGFAGDPAGPSPGDLMNPTKDERNWAMFAHLSGMVVALVASAIGLPMLGFLGPLIIYLVKRDESPFVADQAKEALNFYISVSIIAMVLFVLSLTVILIILTLPLMIVLGIAALVLSIIAAIRASNGELYRYPFTLRLIQ